MESFVKHPNYNSDTQDNDIAIVTVNGVIAFSQQVGPVCLPFDHAGDSFGGNYVDVIGTHTHNALIAHNLGHTPTIVHPLLGHPNSQIVSNLSLFNFCTFYIKSSILKSNEFQSLDLH